MRLIHGSALKEFLERGEIIADCADSPAVCLDEIRVGLSLAPRLVTDLTDIDVERVEPASSRTTSDLTVVPGRFYLGSSQERIRIPNNVIGQMFTRSKYARVGLEFALSSSFIFPGYGWDDPQSFVFEISSRCAPIKLTAGRVYAFLVLYELEDCTFVKEAGTRFPLKPGFLG